MSSNPNNKDIEITIFKLLQVISNSTKEVSNYPFPKKMADEIKDGVKQLENCLKIQEDRFVINDRERGNFQRIAYALTLELHNEFYDYHTAGIIKIDPLHNNIKKLFFYYDSYQKSFTNFKIDFNPPPTPPRN